MSASSSIPHPLQHNGTSQLDRLLEILQPDQLKLDDRSIQELMVITYRYAELIQYYDGQLQKEGDWRCFWEIEALTFLAYLAALNKEELLQGYISIDLALAEAMETYTDPKQLGELPDPRPAFHLQLIEYIAEAAAEIERYYQRLPADSPMKSEILSLIQKDALLDQEHLQKALTQLIGYHKFADDVLDHSRYHRFISTRWGLSNQESYDCILPNGEFDRETLAELFQVFYKATIKICQRAQYWFDKELASPSLHQPHVALYLSFLNLFRFAQDSLNGLTAKHLNHYYEDVLCLRKASEIPDEVHLVFELAQNVHEQLLEKGTELIAGKDGNGRPLIFEIVEDWVVNKAKVAALKNTYFQFEAPASSRIAAGTIANSVDGIGGAFPDPENPVWRGMGDEPCLPNGSIGFAIASPQLILREGQRMLACAVVFEPQNIRPLLGLNLSYRLRLSGAEEWVSPTQITDPALSPPDVGQLLQDINDLSELAGNMQILDPNEVFWTGFLTDDQGIISDTRSPVLLVLVHLPHDSLPIDSPTDALIPDAGKHIQWPVLQIMIDPATATQRQFDLLRSLRVQEFVLGVEVTGIQENLIIQNEFGTFNGTQRFFPFGPQPKTDGIFYIGSTEIFQKSLNSVSFDFDWVDPPASLSDHYRDYLFNPFAERFELGRSPNETGGQIGIHSNIAIPRLNISLLDRSLFVGLLPEKRTNVRGVIATPSGTLPPAFITVIGGRGFTVSGDAGSFMAYGVNERDRLLISANGYEPFELSLLTIDTSQEEVDIGTITLAELGSSSDYVEIQGDISLSVNFQTPPATGPNPRVFTDAQVDSVLPILMVDGTNIMIRPENGQYRLAVPAEMDLTSTHLHYSIQLFGAGTLPMNPVGTPTHVHLELKNSLGEDYVSEEDFSADILFVFGACTALTDVGLESKENLIDILSSLDDITDPEQLSALLALLDVDLSQNISNPVRHVSIEDKQTGARYHTRGNSSTFALLLRRSQLIRLVLARNDMELHEHVIAPLSGDRLGVDSSGFIYFLSSIFFRPFSQSLVENDSLKTDFEIECSNGLIDRSSKKSLDKIQEFSRYTPTLQRGFTKWELQCQDFLHEMYAQSLTYRTLNPPSNIPIDATNVDFANIRAITIRGSEQNQGIPSPPYTPAVNGLRVGYSSTQRIVPGEDNDCIDRFYYLLALDEGYREVSLIREESDDLPLLDPYYYPSFQEAETYLAQGNLYIGLSDFSPGSNISLLIQVQEGSEKNPDHLPAEVSWAYLGEGQEWIPFPPPALLLDETQALTRTGIVQISTSEDMVNESTIFEGNLHWLRIAAREDMSHIPPKSVAALPSIVDIKAQVVVARFDNRDNELAHLAAPLPAKTISKLVFSQSAIKSIEQPFASFNGRLPEVGNEFYRRVSERLRHKNRAVSLWDYERLLLQAYPKVYRAKCIPHTQGEADRELSPAYVSVAVIPDLRKRNGVLRSQPRFSRGDLNEMREYLRSKANGFVSQLDQDDQPYLQLVNPRYEMVRVQLRVAFFPDKDKTFFRYQLDRDIRAYLSPWLYDESSDIRFGLPLHQSDLLHFLETREYVDGLADLQTIHYVKDQAGNWQSSSVNTRQIYPTTSRSILTTFQIAELNPDDNKQGKDPNLTDHTIVVVDQKEDLCLPLNPVEFSIERS
ncbi:MAG: hypothetical protein AAF587_15005 [Bacteroidota bacterium]